jgi:GNAT superfamily N-acetyltransferase
MNDLIELKMETKEEAECLYGLQVRRFKEDDATKVRNLIVRNFIEVNSKDYGIAAMEKLAGVYDVDKVLNIASYAHMYVFEWNGKTVGTGAISSFWGSKAESILLTIFVLPKFHGKGIGRKIINTLEQDEFYMRATRIEIPASITATEFYRKFGYDYKNGIKELDEEHHYRLEKFKEAI